MLVSNLYDDYQFNEPSRSDHYAMQVAQYVRLANSKKGARVRLTDMRIERTFRSEPKSVEEATRLAKAAWAARLPGAKGL
jgi:hypothetical protein